MGETTYISEVEITFPIVLKTDEGDYMRRMVKAYIIEAERVNFLLGKESIVELNVMLDCPDHKIVFKEKGQRVETLESDGGHMVINLELVGEWEDERMREFVINKVEKNEEIESRKAIEKIHKTLNHKQGCGTGTDPDPI